MAVEHAQHILGWQENLTREEMPPRWMWPYDDLLVEHFESIESQRKEKYSGTSNSGSISSATEVVPMDRNEFFD